MRDLTERWRAALLAADYTVDRVGEQLGQRGHAALQRNETTPGVAATADGSPLSTLVRLFLLQCPVAYADLVRALPDLVEPLVAEGVLERSGDQVRALLDCRPYASDDAHEPGDLSGAEQPMWLVSDLTPGLDGAPSRVHGDYVLGVSPASSSLAQLTIRRPVGSALDLGTGCGVQSLHLARHAGRVVATDVNARALRLARLNVLLNDLPGIELRDGSLFEPVAGERFDLIASNPPFVISPATGEQLVYRDSGLPGDRVVEQIIRSAPDHLTPDGWCHVLANWAIHRDQPWQERVGEWLAPSCDALIVRREVLDPAEYVELWLKDAGLHGAPDYVSRYDAWVRWLDEQGVEAIGFGWLSLHRTDSAAARHDLVEWPYDVEQPIAPAIEAWGTAVRTPVDEHSRLVARVDVRQESLGAPGEADPETIVLRQQRGFRRAHQADTVTAGLVGACDGELTVGQILDALAQLLDRDPAEVRESALPQVRLLVDEGFLLPARD